MKLAPCPPATFFVTLRLADRRSDLLVRQIGAFRHAMRATMQQVPFAIDAITVMPALSHMILCMPEGAAEATSALRMLKRRFAQLVTGNGVAATRGETARLWHRDSWTCPLTTALDRTRHRTLIYHAPVEAGLCARPQDWPHSSLHRDLRAEGALAWAATQSAPVQEETRLPSQARALT